MNDWGDKIGSPYRVDVFVCCANSVLSSQVQKCKKSLRWWNDSVCSSHAHYKNAGVTCHGDDRTLCESCFNTSVKTQPQIKKMTPASRGLVISGECISVNLTWIIEHSSDAAALLSPTPKSPLSLSVAVSIRARTDMTGFRFQIAGKSFVKQFVFFGASSSLERYN